MLWTLGIQEGFGIVPQLKVQMMREILNSNIWDGLKQHNSVAYYEVRTGADGKSFVCLATTAACPFWVMRATRTHSLTQRHWTQSWWSEKQLQKRLSQGSRFVEDSLHIVVLGTRRHTGQRENVTNDTVMHTELKLNEAKAFCATVYAAQREHRVAWHQQGSCNLRPCKNPLTAPHNLMK